MMIFLPACSIMLMMLAFKNQHGCTSGKPRNTPSSPENVSRYKCWSLPWQADCKPCEFIPSDMTPETRPLRHDSSVKPHIQPQGPSALLFPLLSHLPLADVHRWTASCFLCLLWMFLLLAFSQPTDLLARGFTFQQETNSISIQNLVSRKCLCLLPTHAKHVYDSWSPRKRH